MGFKVRETVKATHPADLVRADGDRRPCATTTSCTTRAGCCPTSGTTPYLLRIDEAPEHLQAGATWTINYNNTKTTSNKPMPQTRARTETWTVDAVDEVRRCRRGRFTALKVTRTNPADGSSKTQWFVRGVGKVRERPGPATTKS